MKYRGCLNNYQIVDGKIRFNERISKNMFRRVVAAGLKIEADTQVLECEDVEAMVKLLALHHSMFQEFAAGVNFNISEEFIDGLILASDIKPDDVIYIPFATSNLLKLLHVKHPKKVFYISEDAYGATPNTIKLNFHVLATLGKRIGDYMVADVNKCILQMPEFKFVDPVEFIDFLRTFFPGMQHIALNSTYEHGVRSTKNLYVIKNPVEKND